MSLNTKDIYKFRRMVWTHYRQHGRHNLPWRKTHNPYRILVSEIMLQQTQVDRVIPFYWVFIKEFPTVQKLAMAPLSSVLKAWQGLGYNRRAKMLHMAAKEIAGTPSFFSKPDLIHELETLSGVGPYTARALMTFAYNKDTIVIETNIRTAIIHNFFSKKEKVSDKDIEKVLEKVLPKGKACKWYSALMDYGAYLKNSGISYNARNKQYTKQSRFTGSLRESRGAVLRELSKGSANKQKLISLLGDNRTKQVHTALTTLVSEGFIKKCPQQFFTLMDK